VLDDVDPNDEVVVGLTRLIAQARDGSTPATSRISAAIAARTYLEAFTQRLVSEARENGSSWEEIGLLFGTSARNAQARFGDIRDYGD
jgi:hypothetical protein